MILLEILIGISLDLVNKYTLKLDESIVYLISYFIANLVIAIRYLKKRKAANQDDYYVKSKKVSISLLLFIIGLLLLVIVVIDPLENLLPVPDWFLKIMSKVLSNDIYSFVSVVILAPIFEELICRGIILDGFLKKYSPRKAILWSSLIFGLMHLNPWQFMGAFVGGLYIGWIYYRTQSIISCMLIHSVNNMIAFLLYNYFPNYTLTKLLLDNKLYYFLVILISGGLLFWGIGILNKKIKSTHNTQYSQ